MASLYGRETFFTLFAEQAQIYEQVYDQLKACKHDLKYSFFSSDEHGKKDEYLVRMHYILDRPTPVRVKDNEHLTDLSILKHCLLYADRKASLAVYRIGELLSMNLADYITCINDLQLIIERLPSQQYISLLNSVAENLQTSHMT